MISQVFDLYDDDSVREKITVMSKWAAMMDDERNDSSEVTFGERLENFLELGYSYRITIEKIDKVNPNV